MKTTATDPQRPGALGVLLSVLTRTGWAETTPVDIYLRPGSITLEPIRPKGATGHIRARVAAAGGVVGLITWDYHGEELDRVTWSTVTPHNLERVLDYVNTAADEAMAA